jgi:hypothetical protein
MAISMNIRPQIINCISSGAFLILVIFEKKFDFFRSSTTYVRLVTVDRTRLRRLCAAGRYFSFSR